ncbi:MAG: hypothetical protein QOI79_732, partial [Mycobacterium sp.]|nr:hypothetical protein [Mycobacterium sp.]
MLSHPRGEFCGVDRFARRDGGNDGLPVRA